MNKIILLFIASIAISASVFAQTDSTTTVSTTENSGWEQKTLFSSGNGKLTSGFYGGLMMRYGQIDGDGSFFMGGKGAWIINHSFGLGLAGNGMMNRTYTSNSGNAFTGFSGGNGGLLIEPIFFADRPIHFSVPMVIGGGFLNKYAYFGQDFWDNGDYVAFGYFEPGVEIEMNVVSWFRVAFGAYYAVRWDIDYYNMRSDMISPLSIGGTLKFGIF